MYLRVRSGIGRIRYQPDFVYTPRVGGELTEVTLYQIELCNVEGGSLTQLGTRAHIGLTSPYNAATVPCVRVELPEVS